MLARLTFYAATATIAAAAAAPPREVVNFDFAWKHKLDAPRPAPPPPPSPAPWHPKPGPKICSVELVHQASSAECVINKTFGCYDGLDGMWAKDCRGTFKCDGQAVTCDNSDSPGAAYNCSCAAAASTNVGARAPAGCPLSPGRVLPLGRHGGIDRRAWVCCCPRSRADWLQRATPGCRGRPTPCPQPVRAACRPGVR